ncbi:hypothetical protein LTR97_010227 [Elasticomyces elasticus]|uniref:Peptidase C14 caspase domain-containing protein n=1 Tax=Elasticomyces elasticus TaxID=574655 RepID=A0AAN7W4F2_9PEZI|nr:hypothetical protein LTR97_010227 [Elasticomyces elasticus]
MAQSKRQDTKQFAVLIGINAYVDEPLKGCVRDVEAVKSYLTGLYPDAQLTTLTASEPRVPWSSFSTGDPGYWPTHENVTSSLDKVLSSGVAGDGVYIHFSGHGTRIGPSSTYSNISSGDLALVLLEDPPNRAVRYLHGNDLAQSIKNMVDKGMNVALVLDCCFSGSVFRQENSDAIRFLGYKADVDAKYPRRPTIAHDTTESSFIYRNGSMLPNWLINPRGYTILTACGPHEFAKELTIEDGNRRGALSYFLLRTLTKLCGRRFRQQEIHAQLRARFLQDWPQQNPMFFGNEDLSMFGPLEEEKPSPLLVISKDQTGTLRLQAGQAHGIADGDRFALYPYGPTEEVASERELMVYVAKAGQLTSSLEMLDNSFVTSRVQSGWTAEARSRLSLRRFTIQLAPDVPDAKHWLNESKGWPFQVHTEESGNPPLFHISKHPDGGYEIRDGSKMDVLGVSSMWCDQRDYAFHALRHLVEFRFVAQLCSSISNTTFEESFSVHLTNKSGNLFNAGEVVHVKHNKKELELVVHNKGQKTIYLHIYDMGPNWQIENVLHSSCEALPPADPKEGFSGIASWNVEMEVPSELQNRGQQECDDIFKVFITSRPATFKMLELPRLSPLRSDSRRSCSSDELDPGSRVGVDPEDGVDMEAWVAMNFPIRTSMQ